MPFDMNSLLKPPDLHDLSPIQIRLIQGIRMCVACRNGPEDAAELLSVRFGSVTAAKAAQNVAARLGDAWPQPFEIMRPCCRRTTPDEVTAAQMLLSVQLGDRRAFGDACGELLADTHHDGIYDAMALFTGALRAAAVPR